MDPASRPIVCASRSTLPRCLELGDVLSPSRTLSWQSDSPHPTASSFGKSQSADMFAVFAWGFGRRAGRKGTESKPETMAQDHDWNIENSHRGAKSRNRNQKTSALHPKSSTPAFALQPASSKLGRRAELEAEGSQLR